MGSSSVSCVLTGVSLANEPAVLIPLAPANFCYGYRDYPSPAGGARLISNDGAAALFGPLTLPLFGQVGDYGNFEDPEEDAHLALLKERLKTNDLSSFFDAVTYGGHHPRIDHFAKLEAQSKRKSGNFKKQTVWHGNLSGCWVAREAWDTFSKQVWSEGGEVQTSVFDDGWLNPCNLTGLGFVRGKKDTSSAISILGDGHHDGPRYHTPYTHPGLPGLLMWCDEHMSSQASFEGKKLDIGLKFDNFVKGLKSVGLTLPDASLEFAKGTSNYRSELLYARNNRRKWLEVEAGNTKRNKADPQGYFVLVWDNTPQAVLDQYAIQMKHRLREMGVYKGTEPLPPVPEVVLTEPITQVFCDERWHVKVWGYDDDRGVQGHEVSKCVCKGRDYKFSHDLKFTQGVWDSLAAVGWKPKPARFVAYEGPYMRMFPDETHRLYAHHLLSDPMLPLVEDLFTFTENLGAANKILQPTNSGYQCGHPTVQLKVAELAAKLSQAKLDSRNRY